MLTEPRNVIGTAHPIFYRHIRKAAVRRTTIIPTSLIWTSQLHSAHPRSEAQTFSECT